MHINQFNRLRSLNNIVSISDGIYRVENTLITVFVIDGYPKTGILDIDLHMFRFFGPGNLISIQNYCKFVLDFCAKEEHAPLCKEEYRNYLFKEYVKEIS